MLLAGQEAHHYEVPPMAELPRPVYTRVFEIPEHSTVAMHRHPWAQFLYATAGVLNVQTAIGHCMVPPQYAVWIPANMLHGVSTYHRVSFHSLYLATSALRDFERDCTVLAVTSLLRELIMETASLPVDYDLDGPEGRLTAVILDRIKRLAPAPLIVPMPIDPRLLRIAVALQATPGDQRSLDDWGDRVGATRRTLARLFRKETGLSFTQWRQSIRLLAALPRLQAGAAVASVAAELGYDSTSAFIALFQQRYGTTPGAFFKKQP